MKRKLAAFGLCFALAELAAAELSPRTVLPAAVLLLCIAAAAACVRRGRTGAAVLVLAGAGLGAFYSGAFRALAVAPVEALAGQTVTAVAVAEPGCVPAYGAGMLRGILTLEGIPGHGDVRVQCWSFPAEAAGECFTGQFLLSALPKDRYRAANYADGVYLEAEFLGAYAAQPAKSAPRFWISSLRQDLSARLRAWVPQPYGGLAAAMLLGDRTYLDDAAADAFRTAGAAHLLAVSGLHIALLCGLLVPEGSAKRRFSRSRLLARAALVLFYMGLTGAPVSVRRAGIALLLVLLGRWFLQPPDYLSAMGAAAVLFGLRSPYAPCELGFQLSFSAVLGVQAAAALARYERGRLPARLLPALDAVQVPAFAALATLPVLLAHGMAASGVAVLTNLLVVWMLRPALLLGLLVLALSVLPALAPAMHAAGLVLAAWLRGMLAIVEWCAGLPLARLYLPRRYTLWVLAVLGALAAFFWIRRRRTSMLWYLPAAAVCVAAAIALGVWLGRDTVTVALVGTAGNPCVVAVQNGQAAVVFRGGASNQRAVEEYLALHGAPRLVLLADLRQETQESPFPQIPTVTPAGQPPGWQAYVLSDTLTLWLYGSAQGSIALLDAGGIRAAVTAGSPRPGAPVEADVFCAGAAWPDAVQAPAALVNTADPRWRAQAPQAEIYYGSETPALVIRPGRSLIFEEAERLALQ